ncbi:MAG TPA: photosystem II protein Psb27 [Thermosynechococcus sp. M46_R2017_013]|nr:photosystem II protein Psb27 [Thermosynechococcus sp. M46_R2017_013]
MKRFWAMVCALLLSVSLLLTSCANVPTGLTGNFREDTLSLISSLREAIALPDNDPNKKAAQADARKKLNDFFALYRRDNSLRSLSSFMTMQTALNSLAGHYSSYPNRPLPEKLKARLEQEFKQVELALEREAKS